MNKSEIVRVVGCQGTIQLVMGINAMLLQERRVASQGVSFVNILIVHSLFAPNNQEYAFFEVIRKMATSVMSWKEIIYLDGPSVTTLDKKMQTDGLAPVTEELSKKLGISTADELYLTREWQPGNRLLMTHFRDSYCVCFGDAIGLYFKENYFEPSQPDKKGLAKFIHKIRHRRFLAKKYPQRRPLFSYYSDRDFDYGYFVFPDISGKGPSFAFELVSQELLQSTFGRFVREMPSEIPAAVDWIDSDITFLLTSNFSEAGRMTEVSELELYRQVIHEQPNSCSWLIIKPHPRDNNRKLREIRDQFESAGYRVWLMDGEQYFYTPFEFFLLQLIDKFPGVGNRIKIMCTSSSCLGIHVVAGLKPEIAFGENLVRQHFSPDQVELRMNHEMDLRIAMAKFTSSK
jgi:Alpha-2,8-polysialyltransferase (POLYST)